VGELFRFFFLLDALGEDSGAGLGEDFFFFAETDALGEDSGVGLGEDFLFFAEADALGAGVSDGVGLATIFFFGGGDFSGVALGFGVGDFSAVDFFFGCLRGVGVGVGANIFLSLVPKVSSADERTAKPVTDTQTSSSIRSARIGSGNVAQALQRRMANERCHPEPGLTARDLAVAIFASANSRRTTTDTRDISR
jgi:hypothetical protein